MDDFLKIDYLTEKNLHSDLILEIPSASINVIADTYYFALDDSLEDYDETKKVFAVLTTMLKQWKLKIENLRHDGICFLPFDFSDQYIGCFKFKNIKNTMVASYGFTEKITGWMIYPSKLDQFEIGESDYSGISGSFSIERDEFLACLEKCISKFDAG
jgi:hypothetical protein